jgi:hypothetical protein
VWVLRSDPSQWALIAQIDGYGWSIFLDLPGPRVDIGYGRSRAKNERTISREEFYRMIPHAWRRMRGEDEPRSLYYPKPGDEAWLYLEQYGADEPGSRT